MKNATFSLFDFPFENVKHVFNNTCKHTYTHNIRKYMPLQGYIIHLMQECISDSNHFLIIKYLARSFTVEKTFHPDIE